jgi:hypothetical protein
VQQFLEEEEDDPLQFLLEEMNDEVQDHQAEKVQRRCTEEE